MSLLTSLFAAGNQYLTALTLYFVGYVLFEVFTDANLTLCNVLKLGLHRFRAISSSRGRVRRFGSRRSPFYGVLFLP